MTRAPSYTVSQVGWYQWRNSQICAQYPGMNQVEIAKHWGMTQSAISRILNARRRTG